MSRKRLLWAVLAAVALVVLTPVTKAWMMLARMDRGAVAGRVIAEVQRATGRRLTLGSIRLRVFPDLTIDADDVALANPPGFSRPQMVTARHVHARVALLPLAAHTVVLRELTLTGADLKLEQPPGLAANWAFSLQPTPPSGQAAPTAPATGGSPHAPLPLDTLTVLSVTADGTLSWQTPETQGAVPVPRLSLRTVNASSTITAALDTVLAGQSVAITGKFGGQNHLWDAADRTDWPVEAKLLADGGEIDLAGSVRDPRHAAGYDLGVTAKGADLAPLLAAWPSLHVPRLRDLMLRARIADRGGAIDIPSLALTAGASDLSAQIAGLHLDHVAIAAPNIDGTAGAQVNRIDAAGQYQGQALSLAATLGPVGRLLGRGQTRARAPVAIDATATGAGATIRLSGKVAPFGDWSGTAAALHADIPDLAALAPLTGLALPALRDISLAGALRSGGGVLTLTGAHLLLPQADISLEGTARLAGRPSLQGQVTIARLDLDTLPSLMPDAPPPDAASGEAVTPSPTVIPDSDLGFSRLTGADADLLIDAASIRLRGAEIGKLHTHLLLASGALSLNPLAAQLGAATVSAAIGIDAGANPPVVTLNLNAPGLDAATISRLAGSAGLAAGALDLTAALAGTGATPHALAASLSGYAGLALTNATLDNQALLRGLTLLTPNAQLGLRLTSRGRSDVACLATRLDIRQGVAVLNALMLAMPSLRLTAAGAIDLGHETLALRLRPYLVLGGAGLVLPSRADGSWRAPALALEPAEGAASAATLAGGMADGSANGVAGGGLAGTLSSLAGPGEIALALADSGDCAPALAAARDASMTPPPPPAINPKPPSARQKAVDLLQSLFHRKKPPPSP